ADQVFTRASTRMQKLLLATSVLPDFDAEMAQELSGVAEARRILDDLCRRRLFTERRGTLNASYQYHALFREYLRDRAASEFSRSDREELERKAAHLLKEAGKEREAFVLSCSARDWPSAMQLLIRNAEALLDQGRWRTVLDWINALPSEHAAIDPWIQYWRGLSLIPSDIGTSRWVLEHVCEAFQRRGDDVGICLSTAGLIDTYFYEYGDFRPADRWIDLLQRTLQRQPVFPSRSAELKAYGSVAMGLLFRRPGDATLIPCIDRIQSLLWPEQDLNRRAATVLYLVTYCSWGADFVRLSDFSDALESLAEDPDVAQINRYYCLDWLAYFYTIQGDMQRGERLTRKAYALAESSGDRTLRIDLLLTRVFLADQNDDAEDSRKALEDMAATGVRRPFDRVLYDMGRVKSRLTCADFEGAVHAGHAVVASADAIGIPFWQGNSRVWLALALIEVRRFDEAQRTIDDGLAIVRYTCLAQGVLLLTAMDALCKLRQTRQDEARPALQELFSLAQEGKRAGLFARIHRYKPELCAAALKLDIEAEYVAQLVRAARWPAPEIPIEAWPWPIRIYTLGRFALELDGRPLSFEGKAPRRVLALLKVLIALGGQRVPRQQLVDALWRDQDGDGADASLNVAVARLRKLLGRPDAVLVSNEAFTLNRQVCWTDVWAFEHGILEGLPTKSAFQRLRDLYPGDFLPADMAEAWSVRTRLRLRTRFINEAVVLGRSLEATGDFTVAAELYRRCLEADDLAEEFYQGLMRCHLVLGTAAEGMTVFRRLRQMLSVVLGIAPSPESEALAHRLQSLRPSTAISAASTLSEGTTSRMTKADDSRSVHRP
ncbi:MAG: winged helix-turn-helix domain-containing protein, partial [Burkholderiales bacterium]|nr:winged helix-turn-helix domain-containing protein [Burkholderiales bacterium]